MDPAFLTAATGFQPELSAGMNDIGSEITSNLVGGLAGAQSIQLGDPLPEKEFIDLFGPISADTTLPPFSGDASTGPQGVEFAPVAASPENSHNLENVTKKSVSRPPRARGGVRKAKSAANAKNRQLAQQVAAGNMSPTAEPSTVPGSDLVGAVAPQEATNTLPVPKFSQVGQGLTRKGGVVPVGFKPIQPSDDLYVDETATTKMDPKQVRELKRELRLARNRISATNSRNRKKVLAAEMQTRLQAADNHIADLTAKLAQVTEENESLKTQVQALTAQVGGTPAAASAPLVQTQVAQTQIAEAPAAAPPAWEADNWMVTKRKTPSSGWKQGISPPARSSPTANTNPLMPADPQTLVDAYSVPSASLEF